MKFENGTILTSEDMLALYPRRILKEQKYEIWQHPYIREDILEDGYDLQLVVFNDDGSVNSYHVSDKEHRLKDLTHLGKLQLIYHDVTLEFNEHQHLIDDIYSDEADDYFERILK